jgi:hypothetical protein
MFPPKATKNLRSEEIMATRTEQTQSYADAAQKMRVITEECPFSDFKTRLGEITQRLEKMPTHPVRPAGKEHRKLIKLLNDIETLKAALAACQEEGPVMNYCENFLKQLNQLDDEVQEMRAR